MSVAFLFLCPLQLDLFLGLGWIQGTDKMAVLEAYQNEQKSQEGQDDGRVISRYLYVLLFFG